MWRDETRKEELKPLFSMISQEKNDFNLNFIHGRISNIILYKKTLLF